MKRIYSRRQALQEVALGFGGLAMNAMLAQAAEPRAYNLLPRKPHFAPKAKNVIFIYIGGGPSTIDMFDPKPLLRKYDGQPAPFEIKGRALNGSQQVMASPWAKRLHKAIPPARPGCEPHARRPEGRAREACLARSG